MAETAGRIAAEGGRFAPCAATCRRRRPSPRLVAEVVARHGRIDVLVNNVGGSAPGRPVEMAEEVWDLQIDINLKSVFLTCKHVLPVMEAQGGGAIVNLASTSGIRWTGAAQVAYAASKAGVIQLSRVVAVQYAAKGIRVNTVVPGQMHTPMVEARLAGQRAGGDVEALMRAARWPASPWASPATAATPPPRCCSSPPTRRASSPAPNWWWMAACPCAAAERAPRP